MVDHLHQTCFVLVTVITDSVVLHGPRVDQLVEEEAPMHFHHHVTLIWELAWAVVAEEMNVSVNATVTPAVVPTIVIIIDREAAVHRGEVVEIFRTRILDAEEFVLEVTIVVIAIEIIIIIATVPVATATSDVGRPVTIASPQ